MLKGITKKTWVLITSFFILIFMGLGLEKAVLASEVENKLSAPTNFEAVAGEERIKLTWNGIDRKAAGYAVYRGTSENARFIRIGSSTSAVFNDVNAKEGVLYYYYVKAYDAAGSLSESSNIARAMIEKKIVNIPSNTNDVEKNIPKNNPKLNISEEVIELKAPTNLEVVAGEERIKLTWNTTDRKAAGYAVYRSTFENARFKRIGSSTSAIFNDVNAKEGVLYYYYVKAYDAAGSLSGSSNIARAMIEKKIENIPSNTNDVEKNIPKNNPKLDIPDEVIELNSPINLEAVAGEERIKLTWKSTDREAAGYAVYRGTSENAIFIRIGSSTSAVFNDVNAKEGVLYYYYVKAYDAAGSLSGSSNIARAIIKKKIITNKFNLYAQPVEGKILLKWSAVEEKSIAGYAVYKSVSPNHNFTRIGSTKEIEYLDPNITKDIPYYYQVRFYDEKGTISEPSNTAGAIVVEIKKIPKNDSQPNTKNIKELTTDEIINSPQNLKAEAGEARIKLTWEKANDKNIKGYAIYRSTSPNARFARIGSTEESIYNDTKITKGIVYYYQVRAYNLTGQMSLPSNISRTMVDKETNRYAVPKQKSFWLNIKSLLERIF